MEFATGLLSINSALIVISAISICINKLRIVRLRRLMRDLSSR